jgi:hypothetical protein
MQVSVTNNPVSFQVNGSTATVFVSGVGPQGASGSTLSVTNLSASTSLTATQNNTLFTNSAAGSAIACSLPAAQSPFKPLQFSFFDATGDGIEIVASAGTQIQSGADISSSGGNYTSTGAGNFLSVVMVSPTLWIVTNITGIWDVA